MGIIFAIAISSAVLTVVGLCIFSRFESFLAFISGGICFLLAAGGAVFVVLGGYDWVAAGYKVELLSEVYGVTYTQEQIFFADDLIEEIKELNRTRTEFRLDVK